MLDDVALVNLTSTIEAKCKDNPVRFNAVKEIGKTLSEAPLSIEDACLLARISPATFEQWCVEVPEIETYIKIQRITYKKSLLTIITTQARQTNDAKLATQLLATAFPAEFNPAIQKEIEKKKTTGTATDKFDELFQLIQDEHEVPVDTSTNVDREKKESLNAEIANILA